MPDFLGSRRAMVSPYAVLSSAAAMSRVSPKMMVVSRRAASCLFRLSMLAAKSPRAFFMESVAALWTLAVSFSVSTFCTVAVLSAAEVLWVSAIWSSSLRMLSVLPSVAGIPVGEGAVVGPHPASIPATRATIRRQGAVERSMLCGVM